MMTMMMMMPIVKNFEVAEISTGEALTMRNRLVNLKDLSTKEKNSLVDIKSKLGKIRVLSKTQSHINDCFMLE